MTERPAGVESPFCEAPMTCHIAMSDRSSSYNRETHDIHSPVVHSDLLRCDRAYTVENDEGGGADSSNEISDSFGVGKNTGR